MKAKWLGPKDLPMNPDPWRGERELAKNATDDKLLSLLASYKVGTEPYLIMQREIERRKEQAKNAREDAKFRATEFRSWLSVGLSLVALIVSLVVALYK
jgi:hypothetical protein